MLWAISFVLSCWTGYVVIMFCFSKEYREEHFFPKRSTWSERMGTPQEDMTEKECRAWYATGADKDSH